MARSVEGCSVSWHLLLVFIVIFKIFVGENCREVWRGKSPHSHLFSVFILQVLASLDLLPV